MRKVLSKIKKNRILIISIIMLIGWMGVIFYFSSRPGHISSDQSNQFKQMICNIVPNASGVFNALGGFEIFSIRKLAHMFLYFVLSMLSYVTIYNVAKNFEVGIKGAVFVSVIYAAFDEIHQLYVVGRSGQLTDVWIDSIGVFLAIMVISIIKLNKYKKQTGKNVI